MPQPKIQNLVESKHYEQVSVEYRTLCDEVTLVKSPAVDTIREQIDSERDVSIHQMMNARVALCAAFFALHLLMGWILGHVEFRGKEIHFVVYFTVSVLLRKFSRQTKILQALNENSIPLIDIPITTIILLQWVSVVSAEALFLVGGLVLSFNLFYIHLSSFLLSYRAVVLAYFSALASVLLIQDATGIHKNTMIVSQILLALFAGSILVRNKKIYLLLKKLHSEQAKTAKLSRYFSPSVARLIQNQNTLSMDGNEVEVTVLFTDIRDFTKLSESISGREIVLLLNSLHERLVSCIFACDGTLDKYTGDGIMAYFGAPIADEEHADKALKCANLMRAAVNEMNEKRIRDGLLPVNVGIGLHSGKVVVGDIGAEIRKEFTIIGDTVNTASRVEALTKKFDLQILATESVCNHLSDRSELRFVAEESVRGKSKTIRTYTT